MYLDYAKIKSGQRKQPMLRLRTLAGKELGAVPFVHDLKFCLNYSEVSTIEFTVPFKVNGMINPLYAALTSFKVIYTDDFGIYVLESPTKTNDGVEESKEVKGYSLERLFKNKNLFLEEGTYNFWNPIDSKDTILGRIIELDPGWRVGYVAPRLIGCYRTFDQFDSDALSFCYGDTMEKYRCAFVFDVYEKTINIYDAMEDTGTLPIYLSYNNLVESVSVDEISDDIATKLHLSGSDGLTIRDVNPTGKDYIINLDYFLYNGDLDIKVAGSDRTLADRVREWQASIAARQTYYTGLVSARASLTAQKLAADVDLTTMKGDLDTLTAQQSITIQAMAMETTAEGKAKQQANLDRINAQIDAKNNEIEGQEAKISSFETQIQQYMDTLSAINQELSFEGYFTAAEQEILNHYMIEASVTDETFVATDVDTSVSSAASKVSGVVNLTGSDLTRVEIPSFGKTMYVITGGTLEVPGAKITASVMRGTLEISSGNNYVLTTYLGKTDYSGHTFQTGLITIAGILSQLSTDVSARTENEVTEYKGTRFSFQTTNANTYFTVSVNDYQKYSVEMELYDFGMDVLEDYAWPVYEFSVDSANFLYHEKFEPFKNKLELGKAVHLDLGSEGLISAKIIGVELDFEDISSFNLIFSNRYQKKNGMEDWLDEVQSASRAGRSIDANKYTYNRAADKVTEVAELMRQQLVAAVNNIVNAEDQTVLINSSGINIGGNSKYQMRLVDNMIAMTDDGWKTAKLAIGLFATEGVGEQWGVNAEMLAGHILIGNKLILQNPNDQGYMMFQIDETGAWLYNAQFVLQDGNTGGLVIIDPKYGIVAGTKLLFNTNGTTVTPEFLDEAGDITYDSEGMPQNANFYLDVQDGSAYFRGKLVAKSGKIGGYTIENSYLHSGSNKTFVALNGGTDVYADYAIWAGYTNPTSTLCPFWVKKDGTFYAKSGKFAGELEAAKGTFAGALSAATGTFSGDISAASGTFKGTIQASRYLDTSGRDMMNNGKFTSDYLDVRGLNVNNRFKVDQNGNVTITGGSISWNAVTGTGEIDRRIEDAEDAAYDAAYDASTALDNVRKLANGKYSGTFIDGTSIYSPTIYADEFVVMPRNNAGNKRWTGGYSMYGYYGSTLYKMLSINYFMGDAPWVVFESPAQGYARWGFGWTEFEGTLDFGGANVIGLSATFG